MNYDVVGEFRALSGFISIAERGIHPPCNSITIALIIP
jgi:hypothetical protein